MEGLNIIDYQFLINLLAKEQLSVNEQRKSGKISTITYEARSNYLGHLSAKMMVQIAMSTNDFDDVENFKSFDDKFRMN